MKKNIALMVALCPCMSVFAGCSQNSGSETAVPKVENNPSAETTAPVEEHPCHRGRGVCGLSVDMGMSTGFYFWI